MVFLLNVNTRIMNKILEWANARCKEESTLRGVIALVACVFAVIYLSQGEPEKAVSAIAAGVSAVGFIDVIRKENKSDAESAS